MSPTEASGVVIAWGREVEHDDLESLREGLSNVVDEWLEIMRRP